MSGFKFVLVFIVCSIFAGAFFLVMIALFATDAFQVITFAWKAIIAISLAAGLLCALIGSMDSRAE
ncbi:hypothetical protein A2837_01250 [Candidatus Kaiserbacteria bacterium RIFCSPHIGHO2_01_FULL_46_22]|uniref:Uncharacterized protein n=1 Tax=Candidatus Kaiserbacteria bacterium RIFCSPHIGHO2_01_FULL_46_22 TaxID=1798475 RepID=A0A1F6BYH3_9BACT|nr:MAG: hypothetical protein A2837_01250 [Candidatus Kaiserbacteria bacterium RIFCSPHIGHO2_01_FULL_46_22]